jgi:hypothetical protein
MDTSAGRIDNVTGGIINTDTKMEKGLKIWQAVLGTVVLLISMGSIIFNMGSTISYLKGETDRLKSDQIDYKLQVRDLNQRQETQYKEINGKLTDILISLQNKENKK